MLFQKWSGFFRCFLAKSNQALFAPCGESSVFALVKPSLVEFDSDTSASWRVFFPWMDVVKGFFILPWRGSSDHPPLLSSMDVQAYLCC